MVTAWPRGAALHLSWGGKSPWKACIAVAGGTFERVGSKLSLLHISLLTAGIIPLGACEDMAGVFSCHTLPSLYYDTEIA